MREVFEIAFQFTGVNWAAAFDPCPFPVPPGFDGLRMDWRASSAFPRPATQHELDRSREE